MEFVLCRRCIPHFKKEVENVVVATCPPEVWVGLKMRYVMSWSVVIFEILFSRFAEQTPPDQYSCRKKYVPDSDWFSPPQLQSSEADYYLERLTWNGCTNLPSLMHEFWFYVKWISTSGLLMRASIKKLSLCYDSFLNTIKCDIAYDTEFFSDTGRWTLIWLHIWDSFHWVVLNIGINHHCSWIILCRLYNISAIIHLKHYTHQQKSEDADYSIHEND